MFNRAKQIIVLLSVTLIIIIFWTTQRLSPHVIPWYNAINISYPAHQDIRSSQSSIDTTTGGHFVVSTQEVEIVSAKPSTTNGFGIIHHDQYSAIEYTGQETLETESEEETTVYVDLKNFKSRLAKEYQNCADIQLNSSIYWKSQVSTKTNFTADGDAKRILRAVRCGGVLIPEFLHIPPRHLLYPFEVSYLSMPPVYSWDDVSNEEKSWIRLLNSSSNYTLGDTVAFRVDIFDGKGRHKVRGGDRIKVWLTSPNGKHSVTTRLTDFDNGTYLATTNLPWAGEVKVKATLTFPREYIRAIVYCHRVLKSFKIHLGAYQNSEASEGVPCSPLPIIVGHNQSELCNLTELNSSPWYCARPVKPQLGCADFWGLRYILHWIDPLVSNVERALLKRKTGFRYIKGQGNILLNVKPRTQEILRQPDPNILCNQVSPQATWDQEIPTGYFYNKIWRPFFCQLPWSIDRECFKNTKMLVLGDSNGRYFYHYIRGLTKCTEIISAKWEKWHDILSCAVESDNYTLLYMPHSCPYNTGKDSWAKFTMLRATARVLDNIPATGRHIVFFNHYLHFMTYHVSVYEEKLRPLAEALKRLFARNPDAHVLLRAPHVAEFGDATYPRGDNLAMVLYSIQRKVFRDVQDRLIYLPTWDLTVAAGGTDPHPKCNPQIFHTQLGLLCGRLPRKS